MTVSDRLRFHLMFSDTCILELILTIVTFVSKPYLISSDIEETYDIGAKQDIWGPLVSAFAQN